MLFTSTLNDSKHHEISVNYVRYFCFGIVFIFIFLKHRFVNMFLELGYCINTKF